MTSNLRRFFAPLAASLALAFTGAAAAQEPAGQPLMVGTPWYPEQWPESRWDADLALMVRDNARAALQLGLDPRALAKAQAAADAEGDPARHAWRADWIAAVRDAAPTLPPERPSRARPRHGAGDRLRRG